MKRKRARWPMPLRRRTKLSEAGKRVMEALLDKYAPTRHHRGQWRRRLMRSLTWALEETASVAVVASRRG